MNEPLLHCGDVSNPKKSSVQKNLKVAFHGLFFQFGKQMTKI